MKYIIPLVLLLTFAQCGELEPRRPVQSKSGNTLKESVARNKILLEREEGLIQDIIRQDSGHAYRSSGGGTWYHYISSNPASDYHPRTDDLVHFNYDLSTLTGETIYSQEDLGTITYKVDREELFPGLRNGIKLLKEHESATFLIPSSMAYGYHGDQDKIGTNVPIKTTITILKIDKNQN